MAERRKHMLFIGICGASGSGKTTLAEELIRDLGVPVTVIHQDGYYLNHPDMSFEERCHLNYDEPFIFDHDLLYQDICTLLEGKPIPESSMIFPSTPGRTTACWSILPTC